MPEKGFVTFHKISRRWVTQKFADEKKYIFVSPLFILAQKFMYLLGKATHFRIA